MLEIKLCIAQMYKGTVEITVLEREIFSRENDLPLDLFQHLKEKSMTFLTSLAITVSLYQDHKFKIIIP